MRGKHQQYCHFNWDKDPDVWEASKIMSILLNRFKTRVGIINSNVAVLVGSSTTGNITFIIRVTLKRNKYQ